LETTGSPPPPSPPERLTTARAGNQQIQLVTPSLLICTSKAKTLNVALRSVAIAHSRAAKLRFKSAAFFVDRERQTHPQADDAPAQRS
jgi:hypothetical protein